MTDGITDTAAGLGQAGWRLDGWAPWDGLAFIVQSTPLQVFHVSPPNFAPVPTRLATANAATRGPFQDGMTDAGGNEIVFTSLEQATEFVRRCYVAGGTALARGLDVPGPPPEPEGDLPEEEQHEWMKWLEATDTIQSEGDREVVRRQFPFRPGSAAHDKADSLWHWITDVLRHQAQTGEDRNGETLTLAGWATLIAEVAGPGFLHHHHWPYCCAVLSREKLILDGLLFQIPSPPHRHHGHLRTLAQHCCAALADRNYVRSLRTFQDALPLLTCALLIAANRSFGAHGPGRARPRAAILERAAGWLGRELPDTSLDAQPALIDAIASVVATRRP